MTHYPSGFDRPVAVVGSNSERRTVIVELDRDTANQLFTHDFLRGQPHNYPAEVRWQDEVKYCRVMYRRDSQLRDAWNRFVENLTFDPVGADVTEREAREAAAIPIGESEDDE